MKRLLLALMIFTTVYAVTVSSPSSLTVSTNTTMTASVYGASQGTSMIANWTNEYLDIFPGEYPIETANLAKNFYIIINPGACRLSNLTFSVSGTKSTTQLDLGDCTFNFGSPLTGCSGGTQVCSEYNTIYPQILNSRKYLQIDNELQTKIDEIETSLNLFETDTTMDFVEKDILGHGTSALIKSLEGNLPYIVEFHWVRDKRGNAYITDKIESSVGGIIPLDDILFYKIKKEIQSQSPLWGTKDFTLYEVKFYNPSSIEREFYFAEEIAADRWSDTPEASTPDITIWKLTLQPAEIKTIRYGAFTFITNSLTSVTFELAPEPTCSDQILNQGEDEVDCGGPCPACPSCEDGVWNQGEEGVDCGGPCDTPCPEEPEETCLDGIQNQEEEGVDCGGPCDPCPEPEPEVNVTETNFITQILDQIFGSNDTAQEQPVQEEQVTNETRRGNETSLTPGFFLDNYISLFRLILKI